MICIRISVEALEGLDDVPFMHHLVVVVVGGYFSKMKKEND
jgi:hypothetical protein